MHCYSVHWSKRSAELSSIIGSISPVMGLIHQWRGIVVYGIVSCYDLITWVKLKYGHNVQYCMNKAARSFITGSAVALHCCKTRAKINRKIRNSTPCRLVTPENIILKVETSHTWLHRRVDPHANFYFDLYSGGFSPNRRNITTLWLFWLSWPALTFFLHPAPRSNCWTFMAQTTCKKVPFGVRTMGDHIWGKYTPQVGGIGNFKPNRRKKKLQCLQNYNSDQDQTWGPSWDQQLHFVRGLILPRSNPIWLRAAILKNGYDVNSAVGSNLARAS